MIDRYVRTSGRSVWLSLAAMCITASSALGAIRYVDSARPDDVANGLSWAAAKKTLQAALLDATAGDEVWVAQGIYYPDEGGGQIPGNRDATFQLESGVEIYGGFKGNRCVGGTNPDGFCAADADCPAGVCIGGETQLTQRNIDLYQAVLSGDLNGDDQPNFVNNADNSRRVVVAGSTVDSTGILDGFVINGGNYDNASLFAGAGISVDNSDPVIRACRIEANSSLFGGGIGVTGSSSAAVFMNCTVTGNRATAAGGGGGGAYVNSASPIFQRCVFLSNTALAGTGGGLARRATGTTNLIGCDFRGNQAVDGGAVFSNGAGNLIFTSCLFSGNSATSNGGAVHCGGGTNTLSASNSTVSRNTAVASGGGVFADSSGTVTLRNLVLWANGDAGGIDQSAQIHDLVGGSVSVLSSDVEGGVWPGAGNISANPILVDADGSDNVVGNADDDLRLMVGSPCINTGSSGFPSDFRDLDGDGNTAEPSSQDADGNPRTLGPAVDMGGLEHFRDCNDNGLPDRCDLSCGVADAPCDLPGCGGSQDCEVDEQGSYNGIPDECDISNCPATCVGGGKPGINCASDEECQPGTCTGPKDPACDDCNHNGVPDACDINSGNSLDVNPVDEIPDECGLFTGGCTTPSQEDYWTCFDNWNLLGNTYPDNNSSAPDVEVTLENGDYVILDVAVEIPSLEIERGAELQLLGPSAGLDVIGSGLVVNDRLSICSGGAPLAGPAGRQSLVDPKSARALAGVIQTTKLTVDSSGVYQAACPGGGAAAAGGGVENGSLTAHDVVITAEHCAGIDCLDGGQVLLSESMSLTTVADLTLDGSEGDFGACGAHARDTGDATLLSFHTPPSIRTLDNAAVVVGGSMVMLGAAGFEFDSGMSLQLFGDWQNHGNRPECFSFRHGTLLLNGSSAQTFEAAATDMGQLGSFDGGEYALGTMEVAANSTVNLVDDFDNNALGQASCEEAVYVGTLILRQNSTLNVNNCRLYYDLLVQEAGAVINPGGCGAVVSGVSAAAPDAPGADPTGLNKARVISVLPPATSVAAVAGGNTAIKVTLDRMHHVVPPYTGGASIPFSSFQGEVRWVGPLTQYLESGANPVPFFAASLQCTPHYQDWTTVGLLHVLGSAIAPSSSYRVQTVAAACQGIEESCTAVSGALTVRTTRWGDVRSLYNPPDPSVQPDISDVSALVDKFRNAPGAPIKARGLLAGAPGNLFGEITPAVLSVDFGFSHISSCVDAYRGAPYPYTIATCP